MRIPRCKGRWCPYENQKTRHAISEVQKQEAPQCIQFFIKRTLSSAVVIIIIHTLLICVECGEIFYISLINLIYSVCIYLHILAKYRQSQFSKLNNPMRIE